MMKIDWAAKLTSRKFWLAIAGFVSSVLIAFGVSESTITQVVAVISSAGVVIAYVLAEAKIDAEGGGRNDE